jgi:hypothetical protein
MDKIKEHNKDNKKIISEFKKDDNGKVVKSLVMENLQKDVSFGLKKNYNVKKYF